MANIAVKSAVSLPQAAGIEAGDITVLYRNGAAMKIDPSALCRIPDVSGADNGKFLRVVNGQWQAQAVNSAEEVEF